MTHFKYSPNHTFKFTTQTARVFRSSGNKGTVRNNIQNKKINKYANNKFDLLNMVFVSAGIFSLISLGLIFAPNIMTAKVAKAVAPKSQPVTIVTNFNSQEYKTNIKGKSFLQPVMVLEPVKR